MKYYAGLDVSLGTTAICIVDETGRITAEKKVSTCPEAIATWIGQHATSLERVGMETGPLAVWLWNELHDRGLPILRVPVVENVEVVEARQACPVTAKLILAGCSVRSGPDIDTNCEGSGISIESRHDLCGLGLRGRAGRG